MAEIIDFRRKRKRGMAGQDRGQAVAKPADRRLTSRLFPFRPQIVLGDFFKVVAGSAKYSGFPESPAGQRVIEYGEKEGFKVTNRAVEGGLPKAPRARIGDVLIAIGRQIKPGKR